MFLTDCSTGQNYFCFGSGGGKNLKAIIPFICRAFCSGKGLYPSGFKLTCASTLPQQCHFNQSISIAGWVFGFLNSSQGMCYFLCCPTVPTLAAQRDDWRLQLCSESKAEHLGTLCSVTWQDTNSGETVRQNWMLFYVCCFCAQYNVQMMYFFSSRWAIKQKWDLQDVIWNSIHVSLQKLPALLDFSCLKCDEETSHILFIPRSVTSIIFWWGLSCYS